jgi:4-methyl-5(b-hydroxyethyl)-thiazole monophosphate biosynthesis
MSQVAVILADGLEEVEAVTPIDFLRRAGIDVITVALSGDSAKGSHGIEIKADRSMADFPVSADAVVIPGGLPGSSNIAEDSAAVEHIRSFFQQGRLVAAICAAPALVLGGAGLLEGRRYTCYPGFEAKAGDGGLYSNSGVVVDENLITANGVGSAACFAAEIIAVLEGRAKADEIMKATLQRDF